MELRYCEECGNGIQVEIGKPYSITDRFVCESCRQGGPGSKRAREAKPGSTRVGSVLDGDSLNLFSSQTIAIHKQKQETGTAQKPKSSRLRLVKSGSTPDATANPGAAAGKPPSASAPKLGSVRIPAGSATATLAPPAASSDGSANPSKSAQKILFRCLHCRSTLSIRPVERTSKLVCPQCSKAIYVTSSGRLLKSSPSSAVRKDAAGIPEVAGSVRVAKKGSTVQLRAQTGTSATPKPAAKPAPGSSRIQPLIPGGSVRLTRVHPGSPPPSQKPCSAFEEHQARQDPDKTVFITEEPTEDLSRLASTDAMRSVAQRFAATPSAAPPPAAPAPAPVTSDDGDFFSSEEIFIDAPLQRRTESLGTEPLPPAKYESEPRQAGLAQRVLKALFSP